MKKQQTLLLLRVGIFAILYPLLTWSLEAISASVDNTATTHSPARADAQFPYMSGGVGVEERDALSASAKDYNLKLIFASTNGGAYLQDVNVTIAAANDKPVIAATSKGPWFFAKLPAGTYNVTASSGGKTLKQKVTVNTNAQKSLPFYWNVAP